MSRRVSWGEGCASGGGCRRRLGKASALGMRCTQRRCVMATAVCLRGLKLQPAPIHAVTASRGKLHAGPHLAGLLLWGLFPSMRKTIPAYVGNGGNTSCPRLEGLIIESRNALGGKGA